MERLSTETTQKSLVTAFLVFFPLVSIEAINSVPHLLFPCFPVFCCFPVFFLFFGYSHFGTTFLTEAIAYVLHIPGVEHLPTILASVIAHDFAFGIMVIFQGFNWFYIIPLR